MDAVAAVIGCPLTAPALLVLCLLIWSYVGLLKLRDRREEREHLAALNAALAALPEPARPEKTLYRPVKLKEPHRAA